MPRPRAVPAWAGASSSGSGAPCSRESVSRSSEPPPPPGRSSSPPGRTAATAIYSAKCTASGISTRRWYDARLPCNPTSRTGAATTAMPLNWLAVASALRTTAVTSYGRQARALAAARDEREANRALVVATNARERAVEGTHPAGVFYFAPGRAAYYASEVRLSLGGEANSGWLPRQPRKHWNCLVLHRNTSTRLNSLPPPSSTL